MSRMASTWTSSPAGPGPWSIISSRTSSCARRPTSQKWPTCFAGIEGIAEVLVGDELERYGLDHPRSGEIVLVSRPDSWQAYYWWLDDARAPAFARTVDIHRKPGYDPVELFFDPATKSIPRDATLVKGSHGLPLRGAAQRGVLVASQGERAAGRIAGRYRRVRARFAAVRNLTRCSSTPPATWCPSIRSACRTALPTC